MALAENHRNALKMEAAAVSANNNSANMQVATASSNSTAAQLFNSGTNNSANPNAQHAALLQHHQQQNLSNHSRLSAHHASIESPNSLIDDEIGTYDEFIVLKNEYFKRS